MLSRIARVPAGEHIFHKGDPGSGMMAVLSGRVLIYATGRDGRDLIFNIINPGEIFGEIALLDGNDRTADARALLDTEYLVLERRDIVPFLERNPKLCVELLSVLCGRIRQSTTQLEDTAFLELRPRLAKKLLAFAEHYGQERNEGGVLLDLQLSQTELGAMLNVSRESVNRELRSLADEGLLTVRKGQISLRDPEGLRRAADEIA